MQVPSFRVGDTVPVIDWNFWSVEEKYDFGPDPNVSVFWVLLQDLLSDEYLHTTIPELRYWGRIFIRLGDKRVSMADLHRDSDLWSKGLAVVYQEWDGHSAGPYAAYRNPADGNLWTIESREPLIGKPFLSSYRDLTEHGIVVNNLKVSQTTYEFAQKRLLEIAEAKGIRTPLMCVEWWIYPHAPVLVENAEDWQRVIAEWVPYVPSAFSPWVWLVDGDRFRVHKLPPPGAAGSSFIKRQPPPRK